MNDRKDHFSASGFFFYQRTKSLSYTRPFSIYFTRVMQKKKHWIFLLLFCIVCASSMPIIYKAVPLTRTKECYRAFFPKKEFLEKLKQTPSSWAIEQIQNDLRPFKKQGISSFQTHETYEKMKSVLDPSLPIYHFRILDNKLYKYVPQNTSFSDTDTPVEKAIKTLLIYAKLPDMDFVLCGLDGIPEHYIPSDFYLTKNPEHQAPVFAAAKRQAIASQYVVLIPDQLCLSDIWFYASQEILKANKEISWDKKTPIAIWRGGLSDTGEPTDGRFVSSFHTTPRFALCKLSFEHSNTVDAGFAGLDCKEMEILLNQMGLCKPSLSKKEHLYGKYLPVLDGHMCTYPGYQWRLLSNSVALKQESDQVQWFYRALKPYVHYIPITNDMSDLLDKIAWAKEHDEEVLQIVKNGQQFAMENLLYEDLYAYLHLAFCEYAKLQVIDFQKLKNETKSDPRWKCIQYRKRLALQKSYQRIKEKL